MTQEIQQLKDTVQKLQIQVDTLQTQVSKAAELKNAPPASSPNVIPRPPGERIDDRGSRKKTRLPWRTGAGFRPPLTDTDTPGKR